MKIWTRRTRAGTLDANDAFQIDNGELKVTTSRGNVYALEDGKV